MGLPDAANWSALLCENCPASGERRVARGDGVSGQGRGKAERQDLRPPEEEEARIREAYDASTSYTGTAPAGWLGPYLAQTDITLDLLREVGFSYVLDWPADDQPFWMRTRSAPILSVPYSIELNDSPVMAFRQEGPTSFERMMIDQFDEMLLQSAKYPLCYTIVLHPFVIGHPYRLRALRRALAHILQHRDDIWITTPGGVARHYAGLFPAGDA